MIYAYRNMTHKSQETILLWTWHLPGSFPKFYVLGCLWRDWTIASTMWPLHLKQIKLKGVLKYMEIYEEGNADCFHRDERMNPPRRICPDGQSLPWLSSAVLISRKLILFNKSHLFIKSISKCDLTFMPFCKSFQKSFVIKSVSMLGSKKMIAVVKGTRSSVD